jgi:hypothetical protein
MEKVNSHIQITKSLLRGFSHDTDGGEKVYYLDLSDNAIKEEKIKTLGTEYGYYNEDIEKFLSKEVECKIGDISKLFKDFSKQKNKQLIITTEEKECINEFFKYSLIRSTYTIKAVNKASFFSKSFNGYTTNDIFQFANDSILVNFFEKFDSDILLNKSNVEFVIPRNCFYSAMVTDKPTKYVLPINSRTAFILINKCELSNFIIDGKHHYLQISDDDVVNSFNKRALVDEKFFNNAFVVANRKKELEDLQNYNSTQLI